MADLRDFTFRRLREEADYLSEKLARIESPVAREKLRADIDRLTRRIEALMLPIETKLYRRACQRRAAA